MKRILLLAVFGTALLTSCKREYTCSCTTTDSSGQIPTQTTSSNFTATKGDAKAECEGTTTSGTLTVSCKLQD